MPPCRAALRSSVQKNFQQRQSAAAIREIDTRHEYTRWKLVVLVPYIFWFGVRLNRQLPKSPGCSPRYGWHFCFLLGCGRIPRQVFRGSRPSGNSQEVTTKHSNYTEPAKMTANTWSQILTPRFSTMRNVSLCVAIAQATDGSQAAQPLASPLV